MSVRDLHRLISKVALQAFDCPTCNARRGLRCKSSSLVYRPAKIHSPRWNAAEKMLRPFTHPGMKVRRP